MLSRLATLVVLVAIKDLVFRVLAVAPRCPPLVGGRTAAVAFMAVTFAFLSAHVFWALLAFTARVTAAATGMIGAMIIVLRENTRGRRQCNNGCQQTRSD